MYGGVLQEFPEPEFNSGLIADAHRSSDFHSTQ
jgi:hypothetical protein